MVPAANIWGFLFAFLLTGILPIVFLIVLTIKKRLNIRPIFTGMLAFFISQIVVRIPLMNLPPILSSLVALAASMPFLYLFIISFTAGLFEESARLIGANLLKKNRTFKDAFSFGVGHGLCEVIIVVGLTHLTNIIYSLLINSTGVLPGVSASDPAFMILLQQIVAAPPLLVLAGVIERVSAVLLHISLSIFIFYGANSRRVWLWYPLSIAIHAAFNFILLWVANFLNIWLAEAFGVVFAVLLLLYAKSLRGRFPAEATPSAVDAAPPFLPPETPAPPQ